jgi:MFS family permease
MPEELKNIPPSIFLLGLLWAVAMSLGPAGGLIVYWLTHWGRYEMDWNAVAWVAIPAAVGAVGAYWRKYKAQIAIPPAWVRARELAMGVKTVTTTVKTVEQQKNPTATVITTIQETKLTPADAPSETGGKGGA